MQPITIRPVAESDLDALLFMADHTFRVAWQDHNDPADFERYCQEHFNASVVRQEWEHPQCRFYFACLDEEPVAYLKLHFDHELPPELLGEKTVKIERLYVMPGLQGQRIGEQLLHFSEEKAWEEGARWLWLSAWQEAPRTVAFYQKNGFEIFGVETFWLGTDAQDDWLFRKEVGALGGEAE